jgi:hypothetical protein
MKAKFSLVIGAFLVFLSCFAGCDSAGPSNEELAPIATNDEFSLSVEVGDTSGVDPPGILTNDVDPNEVDTADSEPKVDKLSVVVGSVSSPGGGNVEVSKDGSFEYAPDSSFSGTDEFKYRIVDEENGKRSNEATVTIVDEGN